MHTMNGQNLFAAAPLRGELASVRRLIEETTRAATGGGPYPGGRPHDLVRLRRYERELLERLRLSEGSGR